jgi:ATP-binding cassette subfamily C protein
VNSSLSSISKALRQILQSGILGVGAWLVIHQEATGGVMIAASITMGRALAPIEIAIANWKPFLQARAAYDRLELVLKSLPADSQPMQLPNPSKSLDIEGLFVDAPGTQTQILMNISFKLTAGQALGVIGPSASGKSTLARVIANAWLPVRGAIRVDNASLDQWAADKLGAHIGYLPQDIELFDGTIAANIARFAEKPDPAAILEAAQAAGAHDMIVRLPKGYDTSVGYEGTSLSAGQRQRIGLARALYGNPFLVILDEPNAHLDAEGEAALAQAITKIRNREGIAIVIAHRPAALATVDQVLIMANGQVQAFGPKDEVLKKALVQPMPAQKPADEQAKNTGSQPNQYYAMRG